MTRFDKFVRYVLPITIAVIAIIAVIFAPLNAENISLKAYISEANDGDSVSLILKNSDNATYETATYVYDGSVSFKVNPLYSDPAAVYIRHNSSSSSNAYAIGVHSGSFNPENDLQIKFVLLNESEIIERNTYTVTSLSPSEISAVFGAAKFNLSVKIPLIVIILIILAVYGLKISICNDDNWCIFLRRGLIIALVMVIGVSLVFHGKIFRTAERYNTVNLYETESGITPKEITFSGDITQSFVADNNFMNYIRVPFKTADASKVSRIGLKLVDNSDKTEVASSIIEASNILKDGYAQLNISGLMLGSRDKSYTLKVSVLGQGSATVFTYPNDNENSKLIVGKKAVDGIIGASVGYVSLPYSTFSIVLVLLFIIFIVCFALLFNRFNILPKTSVVVIYALLLAFAAAQMLFFIQNTAGTLRDEAASVSYIAHLQANPSLIPDHSAMKLLTTIDGESAFSTASNYLISPPLYYYLMKLFGFVSISETGITVNLLGLRIATAMIGLVGIAISYLAGYTKLNKNVPILHLLYGSVFVAFPSLLYSFSGVGVHSTIFLGVSLFLYGLLRFISKRRTWLTMLLIALGLVTVCLTSSFIGAIALGIFFVFGISEVIRTKSLSVVFNKPAIILVPAFAAILSYYIISAVKYGNTISIFGYSDEYIASQMLDFSTRRVMTAYEYIRYFFTSFFGVWTGIGNGISYLKLGDWFSPERVFQILLVLLPIIFFYISKEKKYTLYIRIVFSLLCLMVAVQYFAAAQLFYDTGLTFGSSIPSIIYFIPFFAFAATYSLVLLQGVSQVTDINRPAGYISIAPKRAASWISAILSFVLLSGGFLAFLIQY